MKVVHQLLAAIALAACAGSASAYDFTVTNSTGQSINGVHATEDGKNWGSFKLSADIPPGGEMKLVWSPETESTGCEWQVKATFADGSESEPAKFDFCEANLNIEFSE